MYHVCNIDSPYVQLNSFESLIRGSVAMMIQVIYMSTLYRFKYDDKYKEIIWYSFNIQISVVKHFDSMNVPNISYESCI